MEKSFLPYRREKKVKKSKEKWSTIIELILKERQLSKILKQHPQTNYIKY